MDSYAQIVPRARTNSECVCVCDKGGERERERARVRDVHMCVLLRESCSSLKGYYFIEPRELALQKRKDF